MKPYAGLVLTLAALLVTGPPSRATEPTPEQQRALNKIRQRGGNVLLDNTDTTVRVVEVNLDCSQDVTDATLSHLAVLTDLQVLRLSFTDVTDAGLAHLKELTRLRVLTLDYTRVTDVGLAHLKGLTRLQELALDHTSVTSRGVARLSEALPKVHVSCTPQPRATLGASSLLFPAFCPDGKTVALAEGQGEGVTAIKLWDVASGKARATLPVSGWLPLWAMLSADGKSLAIAIMDKPPASGDDVTVVKLMLVDVASGKLKATIKGSTVQTSLILAFSPDGKTLAFAPWSNAECKVKLWDVTNGKETATLTGDATRLSSMAFSPDGKTLAAASVTGTVTLWDVASGKAKATLVGHTHAISSVAFSADGKLLASTSCDASSPAGGEVKLWDVAAGQEIVTLGRGPAAFSPDGRSVVAWNGNETMQLWDVATRRPTVSLKGHAGEVTALAFSSDGKTLAAAAMDGTVTLWDVASGLNTVTLSGVVAGWIAFSSDGKTLASAEAGRPVQLWDAPVANHPDR